METKKKRVYKKPPTPKQKAALLRGSHLRMTRGVIAMLKFLLNKYPRGNEGSLSLALALAYTTDFHNAQFYYVQCNFCGRFIKEGPFCSDDCKDGYGGCDAA